MITQITKQMRLGKSSRNAGGPSLVNGKPYRTKELKVEARREAFKGKKGQFISYVKRLYHGAPKIREDLTA